MTKRWSAAVLGLALGAMLSGPAAWSAEPAAPPAPAGPSAGTTLEDMQALQEAFAAAARKVGPSLVSIVVDRAPGAGSTTRQVRVTGGRVELRRGQNWEAAPAAGTGVIITPDGYVLTSTHYFQGQVKRVLVLMPDGTPHEAKVLGRDEGREVVLLKIEAEDLPTPRFVEPETVRVGQWVVALGRTYGEIDPSMNVGIVSATGRIGGRAVQTDAGISPINYGGPLVDLEGRVIGICGPLTGTPMIQGTAFYDSGVGFASTVLDMVPVLPRLIKGEVLKPGFLGVQFDTDRLGEGAAVRQVLPDTAASRANFKVGDLILEVDGRPLKNAFELQHRIGRRYAGEKVTFVVKRGEERMEVEAVLGERPPPAAPTRPATRPTTRPATRPAVPPPAPGM